MHLRVAVSPSRIAARAALLGILALGVVQPALAIESHRRWLVGVRVGDYIGADELGGGFRVSGEIFGSNTENPVKISEVPFAGFTLAYGLHQWKGAKRWTSADLTLELDVSRIDSDVGPETAFRDRNASTRIVLCDLGRIAQDGDEEFPLASVGDITLTPIFVNALFHWGPPRADFYAGGGLGYVLADISESDDYREFVGDLDGSDDVRAEGAMAADIKLGSNLRLDRKGRWYLFVEGQFFSTGLFGGSQVSWPGVTGYFAQRECDDSDPDSAPDVVQAADFRLMDPGRVRYDGAMVAIGLRVRFGKGPAAEVATPAEAAPAGP